MKVWLFKSGALVYNLVAHADWVFAVNFSPCGNYLASAGRDRLVKTWNMNNGSRVGIASHHSDKVTTVIFSKCGGRIVSGSVDKTVQIIPFYPNQI